MSTVRFGSCDAEHRWRPPGLVALPAVRDRHAEQLLRAMDELQAVLCAPGDVLLTSRRPVPAFTDLMRAAGFAGQHLAVPGDPDRPVEERLASLGLPGLAGARPAPYAVLPGTHAAAKALGLAGELPDPEAVRLVNSKTWSTRLGLPGSGTVVTSPEELRAAAVAPCVVKDPYGVSGQGNIVVDAPGRLALIERHLARTPGRVELIVQPLYTRADDFAAHLTVESADHVTWHGIRQIHNEGHAYRGSSAPAPGLLRRLDRAGYRATVEAVAAEAAAAGYRGPLSVDSMTTASGELIPVLEVNARLSPGMIAQLLGARLHLRTVPLRDTGSFERLVHLLDEEGLLVQDGRGVLPLAAGTLAPPRGWLFYAVLGDIAPDLDAVLHALA